MKIAAIIAFVIFLSIPSIGQDSLKTKWVLSLDFGLQAHDKRLYNFPKFPGDRLLAMQPETFGTYQLGISIARKIYNKERLEIFAGIGLSSELSTFKRPFDFAYKSKLPRESILTFTDRYYQHLIQFPIKSKYRVSKRFGFSLDILPQLNFLTVANSLGHRRYSWWRFSFYSVEVNPGIEYTTSRFDFGLKYRIFQIKKIDRILFNETINSFGDPDPRNDKTFETFNPFKLWFSVGYKF